MTITVKQGHIENGQRGSCYECPVALAIFTATGNVCNIGQSYGRADIKTPKAPEGVVSCPLPTSAMEFICDFDNKHPVFPFSFELDLGDEIRWIKNHYDKPSLT